MKSPTAADEEEIVPPSNSDVEWKDKLSNIPFECCIFEYGQEIETDRSTMDYEPGPEAADLRAEDGWVRLHGLFGTTIL